LARSSSALPWILVAAALLVAGALAFVAFRPRPARRRAQPPRERPRARTHGPRVPLLEIHGRVRDTDGLPVRGATVYVLPKDRPGADRDTVDHEVSDAAGAWRILAPSLQGTWIGVVAPGYRSTWRDGDGVDPQQPVELVLTRAPVLEVTVHDEHGAPLADKGVQLEAWPRGATYFCPGPQCRRGDQWSVTDEDGHVSFRLAVGGPLTVTVELEGLHTEPPSLWLPDARGRVELVAHPNAPLTLHVTSPVPLETRADLLTVELLDVGTGRVRAAIAEPVPSSGLLHVRQGVRPGTYHVRASMPGLRTRVLASVRLPPAGKPGTPLEIALEPAREPARLELTLVGNTGERPGKGRIGAPLVWARQVEGEGAVLGWRRVIPRRWNAAAQRLSFALPPGRTRLLVADVLTARAAESRELRLASGARTDLSLPMRPGQQAELPAIRKGDVYVLDLGVRTKEGARLPLYGSSRDGTRRYQGVDDILGERLRGDDVLLGPYPQDEVTVDLQRSDGTHASLRVR
jgi:hypothetical protein